MVPRFYFRIDSIEFQVLTSSLKEVEEVLAIEELGGDFLVSLHGYVNLINSEGFVKNLEIPIQAQRVIAGPSIATLFCFDKNKVSIVADMIGGEVLRKIEPQTAASVRAWMVDSVPVVRSRDLPNCLTSFEITSRGAEMFGLEGYSALVADPDASVVGIARAAYANSPLLFSGPELLLFIFQVVRKHNLPIDLSSVSLIDRFGESRLDRRLRNFSETEFESEFAGMLRKGAAGWTQRAWDQLFRGSLEMPSRSFFGNVLRMIDRR